VPLYKKNAQLYHITQKFLAKVERQNLYDKFEHLRGADLLYACIAMIENLPLVTHDNGFDRYGSDIKLIKPRELYPPSPVVRHEWD